ncbi:MAG: NAD-dependent epimerase/dehydratase family protein [Anaerolineae bacterium]
MRVLLTGAFGNVGQSALEALLRHGHQVRCFDLRTRANERAAREALQRFPGQVEVLWGDLRRPGDVEKAVQGQDVVVHLAFIIPKLSRTGRGSEDYPDWAWEINVGGTRNLLQAMAAQPTPPRILFTSSVHVYGRTQDCPPPRTVSDLLQATEHYSRHKIACEEMILQSGLEWAIFRLAACLPVRLILDPGMFDVPLDNRIEFVHRRDVGLAIARALEREEVWGRVWLIGGGPRCQFTYRDLVDRVLGALGVGRLPEEAFASTPFAVDWMDTSESQRLLDYQHHTLDDYIRDMVQALGLWRYLIRAFRPVARTYLLSRSPYLHQASRERALRSRALERLSTAAGEFLAFCFRCLLVLKGSWARGV